MKISELRIGNFILVESYNPGYKTVALIDYVYNKIGCEGETERAITNCYEIVLTDFWLDKFGLEECIFSEPYSKRYNLTFDGRFTIHLDIGCEHQVFFEGNSMTVVENVHQLQNLYFALTGEELTIKEPES